ncbi:hypothetical protein OHR86_18035 [Streptomyces sp. NBC_00441]|uniref:hypothetical protein n=1 Tax=Streptomyces sp. NBC_00441 TaxID=2975742 RepID=UPI002E2AC52B|nr:hypothetical protein [Streptomyces sp. NBC_00441]
MRISSTYAGFLQGYPCGAANEMVIRRLKWQAEQAFPGTPTGLRDLNWDELAGNYELWGPRGQEAPPSPHCRR